MAKKTEPGEVRQDAGLFKDLAQPSEVQVQQARAQAASKRSQGAPA